MPVCRAGVGLGLTLRLRVGERLRVPLTVVHLEAVGEGDLEAHRVALVTGEWVMEGVVVGLPDAQREALSVPLGLEEKLGVRVVEAEREGL